MKNIFVMIVLLIAGQAATATSLHPDTFAEVAVMNRLQMDPHHYTTEVQSAKVFLNKVRQTIKLEIKFRIPACAIPRPGFPVCKIAIRPPLVVELPILGERVGRCGEISYLAKEDARPRDGNLEQINLIDRRSSTCKYLVAPVMTEVQYMTITAGFRSPVVRAVSKMSGPALRGFVLTK
jgi:hypothetical protein